jgi:peptide-methionine (S)-S-oxide reductase
MKNNSLNFGFSRFGLMSLCAAVALCAGAGLLVFPSAADEARAIPAPLLDEAAGSGGAPETAILAGGCFWGVQGVFQHVNGVSNAVSGYAGGEKTTARYEMVGTGTTQHAEAVRITFDPQKISYGRILQIYFSVAHDPTQVNRQGPDTGTQYRSAIFPLSAEQERIAKAYINQINAAHVYGAPIATRIDSAKGFYPAEAYHQDFLTRNPNHPYIVVNDMPKINDLKLLFPNLYRPNPVLVSAR